MYLNQITNKTYYIVKGIDTIEEIKRRLNDIEIVNDTRIKLLYISPSKRIKAYLVRNSIIAIRDKNASLISGSEIND